MSSFTQRLSYENTDRFEGGRRVYRLLDGFRYYVGDEGSSLYVDVPAGFACDLASIPSFARVAFSPDGPWAQPAVLHDWLYRENLVSRLIADRLFLESMGVPLKGQPTIAREDRWMMYLAVRIGGGGAYRRYGEERRRALAAADEGGA